MALEKLRRCQKIGNKFYKTNQINEDDSYENFLYAFIDNLKENDCILYSFDKLEIEPAYQIHYERDWIEGCTGDNIFKIYKDIKYSLIKELLELFFKNIRKSADIWEKHNVGICLADLGTLENIIFTGKRLSLIDVEDFFTVNTYSLWAHYWEILYQCFICEIDYYYLFNHIGGHHVRVNQGTTLSYYEAKSK